MRSLIFVSAVTAFEFVDLNARGRFGDIPGSGVLAERLRIELLDYPAAAWHLIEALPDLHRDPIDRMLVAHAIHAGLTLVTADATMRGYPVATLW